MNDWFEYVSMISIYVGENIPDNWMRCEGQKLNVAQYPVLFAFLQYKFGGSGIDFYLPDMRGKLKIENDNTNDKSHYIICCYGRFASNSNN